MILLQHHIRSKNFKITGLISILLTYTDLGSSSIISNDQKASKSLRVPNNNEASKGSLKESDKIAARSLTAHGDNDLERRYKGDRYNQSWFASCQFCLLVFRKALKSSKNWCKMTKL